MPKHWECGLCPNYWMCLFFRGEEAMTKNPCPYEVHNGKVEKPTAPSLTVKELEEMV